MDRRYNPRHHQNPIQEELAMDGYDNFTEDYQEFLPRTWQPSFAHPQSEDDYFDDAGKPPSRSRLVIRMNCDPVDVMSSPTPLPRHSMGPSHHAPGRNGYPSSMACANTEDDDTPKYDTGYQVRSYPLQSSSTNMQINYKPRQGALTHLLKEERAASCSLSNSLVPVSTLPDWCRNMFKFGVFNAMQSHCFDTAINTDSNMVISAPTGAGKTVIFELAIIHLLQSAGRGPANSSKCVYMAPTKAICSERSRDWSHKFAPVGVKCCELTGDTMKSGRSAWKEAKDCAIIITTPEKWDSLTRNWNDSRDFLQQIKLFMVHTVSEATRGSCLEVVISRMMQRGNNVRFALVSATAPNIEDLKDWLSSCSSGEATAMFKFGDEYRPCKLQRHVYGISRPPGHNDFQFMKTLDYKLFPIIQQHSTGKPVLIFCPTRKSVMSTATYLMETCQTLIEVKESLPWSLPSGLGDRFTEPQLQALSNLGIGVHHAGLSLDDRRTVEDLFTQRKLSVIVATSTLAVGVNFPAHVVIIKGTVQWTGSGWAEYSSQDVMQMLGRAGRPQFDREGIAVIMCDKPLEDKYRLLATGGSGLESTLHHNLTEHINSEIGLGESFRLAFLATADNSSTIKDIDTAKQWLRKTFLFCRTRKNPKHYNLDVDSAPWEECIEALVTSSVDILRETQLVKGGERGDQLLLTEFGEIMSRVSYEIPLLFLVKYLKLPQYYIRQSTMKLFIEFTSDNSTACLRSVLTTLSGAEEFKDMHMRGGERQASPGATRSVYNKLSEHESIRFPVKKAETSADKASLLIQASPNAVLGGVPLMSPEFKSPNSQPHMEALNLMRHAPRMITALVDTALVSKNGAVMINGMSLMRSLNGKAWEDRPAVLKQLEGIGEKSYKVLAENGITSIKTLATQDSSRIEMLLNRRPPFGSEVISSARALPTYSISVKEVASNMNNVDMRFTKTFDTRITSVLTISSDNQLIDFRRVSTKRLLESADFRVTASLTRPSQTVLVIVSPDKFAGITERHDFKPSLPPNIYPTPNTRPPKASERIDPTGGEDVLDLTLSDSSGESPGTKPKPKVGNGKATKDGNMSKSVAQAQKARLPNGKYACLHICKNKTACRHMCCREGLLKPPPSPKRAKAKPKDLSGPELEHDYGVLSSPSPASSRSVLRQATQAEKQKLQLDYLHNKTTNRGIPQVQRTRLQDNHSVTNTTTKHTQSMFDNSSTRVPKFKPGFSVGSHSSDDLDLPEPADIRVERAASPSSSGPNSYDDSEMDQWAANLPSEALELDIERSPIPTKAKQEGIDVEPVRHVTSPLPKRDRILAFGGEEDEPTNHIDKRIKFSSAPRPGTSTCRVPGFQVLPTPCKSQPWSLSQLVAKPLFRPSSSIGVPSPEPPEPVGAPESQPRGEDNFEEFMDYMFEGVKIVTSGESRSAESKEPQDNSNLSPHVWFLPKQETEVPRQEPTLSHAATKVPSNPGTQENAIPNAMDDFNAWLDANGL